MGPPMKMQSLEKARRRQEGIISEEENKLNQFGDKGKEKEAIHRNLLNTKGRKE